MKISSSLFWGLALALSFGVAAQAETPREEVAHAYHLLKGANTDYFGHRVKAMEEVHAAGLALGLKLEGEAPERERQWKSDEQLTEARRLLQEARLKLEIRDRNLVAAHVDKAVEEIDLALKPPVVAVRETAREELVHAFRLLKEANGDYAGHRAKAMEEVHAAGLSLGLKLEGEAPERERQWKSDEQLTEARRLLQDARTRLEAQDREHVASHVDRAIEEIDGALRLR